MAVDDSTDLQLESPDCVKDDGRIDIATNSKFFRRLGALTTSLHELSQEERSVDPPRYSKVPSPNLKLNIVIQVVGSRGDVQPFVALGMELALHGHRIRLATHQVFQDVVRNANLEFYPIGGDPAELMAYMVKNPGLIPSVASLRAGEVQKKRAMMADILDGCWKSCIEPDVVTLQPFVADAVIANPPSFAHVHVAQALGVPLHLMFTMPWTSTKAFPHPLVNLNFKDSNMPVGLANFTSYTLVEWMQWQGLGDIVNAWRAKLDLETIPWSEGPRLAEKLRIPFTYCWSSALIPKPTDWASHIDICGFFFREPPDYRPEESLRLFLERGAPPLYIGFGSIVLDQPDQFTNLLVDAVLESGNRAIISRGWSKLGASQTPHPDILFLDDCPHEWLFKYVSAVIHHGGAGTTACGLLHERPTFVIPFFGDQPFWGAMVAAAGAGPEPITHIQLTRQNLKQGIEFCLSAGASSAASQMAQSMRSEFGVQNAVDSFHVNLPVETMRCDLLPDQTAAWITKVGTGSLKLSKVAAELLIEQSLLRRNQLERYHSSPIWIENHRWEPVTAITSSLASTGKGMVVSTANIVIKPIQVYRGPDKACKPDHTGSSETNLATEPSNSPPSYLGEGESIPDRQKSQWATFLKAAGGSASGLGGFFKHLTTGMLVDLPVAAADGVQAIPRLYGGQVRDHGRVKDWKSGAVVAGKTFGYGITDGVSSLVKEPVIGVKQQGAIGIVKGVGKGAVGMATNIASAGLGVIAYPGQGALKSIKKMTNRKTRLRIADAVQAEGQALLIEHALRSPNSSQEVSEKFFGRKAELIRRERN